MKLSLLSLLVGSAAAFAPAPTERASVALNNGIDDLKAIAEKSNPALKVRVRWRTERRMIILFPIGPRFSPWYSSR